MNQYNQLNDLPVTVDVLQQVKPGCEAEFEKRLSDLIVAAEAFDGHLGVNVFRPNDRSSNLEYRIVFKFDHLSNLTRWENSPIRQRLIDRIKYLTVNSKYQRLTGLETWFTLPRQDAIAPSRYKMVFVTWLVIFPLSNIISPFLNHLLSSLPPLLRSAIGALFMVLLMTYVVMPPMTKLLAGWLYPKSKG